VSGTQPQPVHGDRRRRRRSATLTPGDLQAQPSRRRGAGRR
jgi:hypothetical protein